MIVLLNVYICALRNESEPLLQRGHSKMYTPSTIANSETDRVSTKINKNGVVAKVRILVELGMLYGI